MYPGIALGLSVSVMKLYPYNIDNSLCPIRINWKKNGVAYFVAGASSGVIASLTLKFGLIAVYSGLNMVFS